MNRADADHRQHQHDRFRARRHIDRDAVALPDAARAECGGDALDLLQQAFVGKSPLIAALVEVDQRGVAAATVGDVMVERVVGEVGPAADEPSKRGLELWSGGHPFTGATIARFEHAVPRAEPWQLPRSAIPERLRIAAGVVDHRLDGRWEKVHRYPFAWAWIIPLNGRRAPVSPENFADVLAIDAERERTIVER